MKYDIAGLLNTALKNEGVEDIIDSDLSNHSTITLDMKEGIPSIKIQTIEDEVWVWSQLGEMSLNSLTWSATNIFPLLLEHDEDKFYAGQPCLCHIEESVELRAIVKDKHLETSESLLYFLDAYLAVVQKFQAALA